MIKEPFPEFEFDFDAKQVRLRGRLLPIANVWWDAAQPERSREDMDPLVVSIMERAFPGYQERSKGRPLPATDEVVHINVLTGENGWWVEVAIYPEDQNMVINTPEQPWLDWNHHATVDDLIALIALTGMRDDAPPSDGYEDPYGGMEPGTWHVDPEIAQ